MCIKDRLGRGDSFGGEKTRTQTLRKASSGRLEYDLVGKVAQGTVLTRKTVVEILKGLRPDKLLSLIHIYSIDNISDDYFLKRIPSNSKEEAKDYEYMCSMDIYNSSENSKICLLYTSFACRKRAICGDRMNASKEGVQKGGIDRIGKNRIGACSTH